MIPIAKPYLTEDEAKSAHDTILTGWVTQGPVVEEFEKRFCQYTGAKHAAAISNGTTALHLAMIVAGIGPGDEVICPSMSFIASTNCISYTGATPVFAEIDPSTYNIDPKHVEKLITKKTKAILTVHQIGLPADIDAFKKICDKHGVMMIEDAACAVGSAYKGSKIGTHSSLVCFSFHPRKVITTGEGGMITTDNEDFLKKIKLLRHHGMAVSDRVRHSSEKIVHEDHVLVGYNYRMTDIQASIGIRQLEKLDMIISERRKIAETYIKEFSGIDCIRLPVEPEGYFTNYQSFCIYLKKNCPLERDELMQKLLDAGISVRAGIMNTHRTSAYNSDHPGLKLPTSEDAADRSLMIPLYVPMDERDVNHIISTLINTLKQ